MSTSQDCTTKTPRYCRICGDVRVVWSREPSGAACLECPECHHSVEPSTVEYSTLAEPRRPRATLRRKLHAEALEVARELCQRQASEDWSEPRNVAYRAALIIADATLDRDPAQLRRLLEVA